MIKDTGKIQHYAVFDPAKNNIIIGVDDITETSAGVDVPSNYFRVPMSVQKSLAEHPFGTFHINNGDIESIEKPFTLECLRSTAVSALIKRMQEVLGTGVAREKNGKHYRFPCNEETVMQLTLFSNSVMPMYVKAFNVNTCYFEAVEFTVVEIQNIQHMVSTHWSSANRVHLDALNEIKRATSLQQVLSICKGTGVEVL
jgi:hypothetical protein